MVQLDIVPPEPVIPWSAAPSPENADAVKATALVIDVLVTVSLADPLVAKVIESEPKSIWVSGSSSFLISPKPRGPFEVLYAIC